MSALSGHVEDYLRLRRELGFKLERAGQLLPPLVAYLEAAGARAKRLGWPVPPIDDCPLRRPPLIRTLR
jgi:hypothetical protein